MNKIFRTPYRYVIVGAAWLCLAIGAIAADATTGDRDRCFESGWCFLRADASGAEAQGFDDASWRTLEVPQVWSIEDLPPTKESVTELPVVTGQP